MNFENGNGKFNWRREIGNMKKTFERFGEQIYNYTYEKDIRTSCYGALIEYLDYFMAIIPTILKSENGRRWGGKAAKQIYITMLSTIEYTMKKIVEK